jgi:FAD/FMN-containing dehydrogenase
VDFEGILRKCSRSENPELFKLAIGGYGLFGVITTVKFRLSHREKLERTVEIADVEQAVKLFQDRINRGFLYGDFQYAIDPESKDFLKRGVFSTYRPVDLRTPISDIQKELAPDDWKRLYFLAHQDKSEAFKRYSQYYLSTSGQIYWSDLHQMSVYLDDYHKALDQKLGEKESATEMITEVYVPRKELRNFFDLVREDFRKNKTNVIYGTIRLIEEDNESFLAWAKKPYACIIFNLHVVHTPSGIERAKQEFRGLIDRALQFGGSYFLTYHRWATRDQVEQAYPQFIQFLRLKRKYDPEERFQSDWYRHYKQMFRDRL